MPKTKRFNSFEKHNKETRVEGAKRIKQITKKDKAFFHALRSVGYLQKEHCYELRMTEERVKRYVLDGYLQEIHYRNKRTKKHEVAYRLTDSGKDLARKHIGKDDFYSSTSPNHDKKLADVYMSLDEETRQTWKTEVTLKRELDEEIEGNYALGQRYKEKEISVTDGAYQRADGSYVLVEIFTKNYGVVERTQKQEYANSVGCDLETYKA